MKEPLPEWGPVERDARLALNCLRYELDPKVANDAIGAVLAAFAELRAAPDAARLIAEAEKILAHRAVASPFRESLREAVEQARSGVQSGDAARLRQAAEIIERADARCLAADGPVGRIQDEMTDAEWRELYVLIRGSSSQEGGG